MPKNPKKITPKTKKLVQFLVQDFLEADAELIKGIAGDEQKTEDYWNNLVAILFDNAFWMDQLDPEDMGNIDHGRSIVEYHALLKPMWDQFKVALLDYKNEIIPSRDKAQALDRDIENLRSTEYYQYKDLLRQSDHAHRERFYDMTVQFKFSFDPGRATFYKRTIDVVNNFIDLLSGLPLSFFRECNHCGKFIVMTRSDKRFCPGCAAKKNQKDRWRNDSEGMKLKEKIRYRTKRKQIDGEKDG
ncbi:hypothetical protein [uncultured Desulfosarcina sp.]|uniref:hypothetical protein n=1 Tax=uncultured Desulfosarcina sp. TaxID=218289 RepID=UPI0029C8BD0C|nr:hypothetical protein [uncultured Desulfosarcina sp.]